MRSIDSAHANDGDRTSDGSRFDIDGVLVASEHGFPMNWLWTRGGGYNKTGELWTYDGRHAGRFDGKEVYDRTGLYLGG